MPTKCDSRTVPFQIVTRSSATQTPLLVPGAVHRGRGAVTSPSRDRSSSAPPPLTLATPRVARIVPLASSARKRAQIILVRHCVPAQTADQQELLNTLRALVIRMEQAQAAQLQRDNQLAANHQGLIDVVQNHLHPAGLAPPIPTPPPSQYI